MPLISTTCKLSFNKYKQLLASASLMRARHSATDEIHLLCSPETLKPSISWVWFPVKPHSSFTLHRCAFSPQYIVPAMNYRHNWLQLAGCLDLHHIHPTRKSNQMYRHHVDVRHFMHTGCTYILMCINTDVIFQECSNLWSWMLRNVSDCKSHFWLFDLFLPAAKNLSINLCCSMFMWWHIKPQGMWDRHKQRWSSPLPGHMQGNRARRKAGLFVGLPRKSPIGKSGTPMIFICHKRQKQSVRVNRKQLISEMENWIIGWQEIAGHYDRCMGLQMPLQGPYLLHAGKWMVNLERTAS